MYSDLKGKTAVVTGAGKKTGIGYAVAATLAENGCNVVLADLTPSEASADALDALADGLNAAHGVASMAVALDVTDTLSVNQMAAAVSDRFGRVDILCNNAGSVFGVPDAVHTYDEAAWMKTVDVNLHGPFRVSKAIVPLMSGKPGSIVNSASQAGKKAPLFNGAYAAAKAGLIMMTKAMALELAGQNIRVNAICPGVIMTDFTRWRFDLEARFLNATPEERMAAKCAEIPMGRLGTPAEVAAVVAFLCSEASAYMTGQALNITGGQTMEL